MKYNREAIIEKNITLSFEFEHPEVLGQLPDGAEVVLLPKDDPELYRINLAAAQKARQVKGSASVACVEIGSGFIIGVRGET